MRPFEPAGSHPEGCAALCAGEKIDRTADAQREAAGAAPLHQHARQDLLLRAAHRQQAEPERSGVLDEAQTGVDGRRICDEAHRRIDMAQTGETVALLQLAGLQRTAADQDDLIVGRDDHLEQFRGDVAARADRQAHSERQSHELREEPAVEQHEGGGAVDFAKRRIVEKSDDVVDVGGDGVAVVPHPEICRNPEKFLEVAVAELQSGQRHSSGTA